MKKDLFLTFIYFILPGLVIGWVMGVRNRSSTAARLEQYVQKMIDAPSYAYAAFIGALMLAAAMIWNKLGNDGLFRIHLSISFLMLSVAIAAFIRTRLFK